MKEYAMNSSEESTLRGYMLTLALFMTTATALAQKQTEQTSVSENDSLPDKLKTTLTLEDKKTYPSGEASISDSTLVLEPVSQENSKPTDPKATLSYNVGIDNLTAALGGKGGATLYSNTTPYLDLSAQMDNGFRINLSILELLIFNKSPDNQVTFNPILSKFMFELGKKLQNGDELVLRVGRENTQGGDVFPNSIKYGAENDIVPFGNGGDLLTLRLQKKDGTFVDLGVIANKKDGRYLYPNLEAVDFFGKGHLSLANQSGLTGWIEGAIRLGPQQKLGIASVGLRTRSGFGGNALVEHDFKQHDTKVLGRLLYGGWRNGPKIINEYVYTGKGSGLDIRLGLEKQTKKGTSLQFFVQANTAHGNPMGGMAVQFGTGSKGSKTIKSKPVVPQNIYYNKAPSRR